jgi:hypothetical protein
VSELATVDLEGVEILAAGGPVRGFGSPPEGDYWGIEDLVRSPRRTASSPPS